MDSILERMVSRGYTSWAICFFSAKGDLSFLGIFVGAWAACGMSFSGDDAFGYVSDDVTAVFCYYIHKYLEPIFDANNGIIPEPEIRLYPAPIAAVCIPIAMFGFGWSGMYPSVHWMVPV